MREAVYWWLLYLQIFARNTPFGRWVKVTIGVSAYDGERVAAMYGLEPEDAVDACGLPCKQIELETGLIAMRWRVRVEETHRCAGPSTWGGMAADVTKPGRRKTD
jgi:hypothetical protein